MNCGKRGYETKKDALTVRNLRTRGRGRRGKRHGRPEFLRAYCCPDCGLWHLTHKR